MRIVKLEVSNVKRLSALEIVPKGSKVTLAGKNGAGKSSTLDCIEMALAGGKTIPTEPVRRGARKGYIVLDLGDLVVERTFNGNKTALVVRDAAGVEQRSPQAILDALCGRLCFDPLQFSRAKPAEQDKMLKAMLGLDFTDLDRDRQVLYDGRTEKKKELAKRETLYEAMPEHRGVPDKETPAVEVANELNAAREHNQALRNLADVAERQASEVARIDGEIAQLEAQLAQAREKRVTAVEMLEAKLSAVRDHGDEKPTEELEKKLATLDETNAKVRANQARKDAFAGIQQLEKDVAATTDAIEAIDEKKQALLAAAEFPVPGLGFDETGPTLNGVPLEQASQAEKVKLSCAIGLKMNPQLKILLIREAVFLDDESLAFIEQLAEENDAQVWLEMVKSDDPSAIHIEDGTVRESATAAE